MYKLTKTQRKQLRKEAKAKGRVSPRTEMMERGAAKILGLVSSNIHSKQTIQVIYEDKDKEGCTQTKKPEGTC